MSFSSDDVQKLYIAYLGRPADKLGLDYWMASPVTLNETAAMFASSPEYAILHGDNSTTTIIAKTYQFLFNKQPDAAGLQFWFNAVEVQHAVSKATLPLAIALGAGSYEGQILSTKIVAASGFTSQLDTTAEIVNYPTAAGEQVGRDYLASVGLYNVPSSTDIGNWIKKIPGAAGFAAEQHFDKALAAFGDVAQDVSVAHHQDQQHDVIDGHASLIGQHGHTLLEAVY